MKKTLYTCPECGSENVMHDAYVMMNDEDDVRIFDDKVCDDCSAHFNTAVETEVDEPEATTEVHKQCTMNCGPALGDTRSDAQRKADCTDCLQIDVAVPDPEPTVLRGDELLYTTRAMDNFGGGFSRAIATALRTADSTNAARLQQAFPELISKYGPGSDFYTAVLRDGGTERNYT